MAEPKLLRYVNHSPAGTSAGTRLKKQRDRTVGTIYLYNYPHQDSRSEGRYADGCSGHSEEKIYYLPLPGGDFGRNPAKETERTGQSGPYTYTITRARHPS